MLPTQGLQDESLNKTSFNIFFSASCEVKLEPSVLIKLSQEKISSLCISHLEFQSNGLDSKLIGFHHVMLALTRAGIGNVLRPLFQQEVKSSDSFLVAPHPACSAN